MSNPTPENVVVVDSDDVLSTLGKAWWIVFATGVFSIILGALFLIWPGKTIAVIAIIFGVWLIVSGIVQLVQGFNRELSGAERTLAIFVGAISLILGVLSFRGGITNGVYILSLFVGFSFLFRGIWQLVVGIQARGRAGRGLLLLSGLLGLIAGVLVLAAPFESLEILALITGIWLIFMGLIETIYSFALKRAVASAANAVRSSRG